MASRMVTRLAAVMMVVGAVACSSGSDSVTNPGTNPGGNPGGNPGTQPPASGNVSVAISGFAFSPQGITVAAGSTVTWTNNDAAAHTVSANGFDSGDLGNKGSFSQTFPTKGTFSYHCAIHPSMTGTVTVQ